MSTVLGKKHKKRADTERAQFHAQINKTKHNIEYVHMRFLTKHRR